MCKMNGLRVSSLLFFLVIGFMISQGVDDAPCCWLPEVQAGCAIIEARSWFCPWSIQAVQ